MPHGDPPKHTTWCVTCSTEVGAISDRFSRHRDPNSFPEVWKTSPHRADGKRCPGSQLSVSPTAVFTRVLEPS